MKPNTLSLLPCYLALAMALLASCTTPQITTQALVPAGAPEVTQFKVVAVLPFDGVAPGRKEGIAFSAQLESVLASIRVNDQPYFTVVDRQKVNEVMKELALSQSGIVDERTVARIGEMTGARAIYTGTVSQSRVSDSRFSTKVTECPPGSTKCYDREVPCTRRTATYVVTPKLIDVQTGRIVYSKTLSGSAVSESCAGQGAPLSTQDELRQASQADVVSQVQADAAPHYVSVSIPLLEITDGIEGKPAKEQLDRGVTFAKKGRFDRACEEWLPAYQTERKSPALSYDAGVCSELGGNLQEALTRYQQADKLYEGTGTSSLMSSMGVADPTKIIGDAITRVQDRLRKQVQLQQQS